MSSSGTHIQLSFGAARDNDKQNYIKLNLPPDYRKDALFEQLPYLVQLDNPDIADVVQNRIVDIIPLQKYLMATGLLINSIQDSLNIIVSDDGKLSYAVVIRQLDTKILSAMRKPIPVDATLHEKPYFLFPGILKRWFFQTNCTGK